MANNCPSENTLTVNATHQMLSKIERPLQTLAVLSPSRKMENILGYDVNLPLLKSVVFQYKRPYTVKSDNKRRFSTNPDQWQTLMSLYDPKEAFFTFPEVVEHENLDTALEKTVFIDVWGLKYDTSLVYVPKAFNLRGSTPMIEAKVKNGRRYPVPSQFVYTWDELYKEIDSCKAGLRINSEDGGGEFERFRNRVDRLTDNDIDWVLQRISEVSEEQAQWIDGTYLSEDEQGDFRAKLKRLTEEGTDLSTYRIGRSKHAMFTR